MTDYEYIITQCQKYRNCLWDENILKDSIEKINTMSDEDRCDLLFEKVIHVKWTDSTYPFKNEEEITEYIDRHNELLSAIVKTIPTSNLVEIIYSSPNDYIGKKGRESSLDFLNAFGCAYRCARDELRNRYTKDLDREKIEKAFYNTNGTNRNWLKWQMRKREIAEIRYQDPFLEKLKDKEIFVDEEFVDHATHGFENVISIKDCRNFWDEDGKRMSAIDFILSACGVVPQFIGLGDEVVFAVASDSYELESAFEYKPEHMNSPLRNKIDKIFDKEYDKDLVLGCILVEKFIHLVDPKINAIVKCYDKEYMLGRFVIECPDELFTPVNTIADLKDLMPKDEKNQNDFLDLVGNLLDPSWKNGLDRYSFMDLKEDTSELPEELPF